MAILLLEEHRPGLRPIMVASSSDRSVISAFWDAVLIEADATVKDWEARGDETLAALERAERDRLRRVAGLFGGEVRDE